MRILIGTYEICGWVGLLQREFRRLGHQCETFVKQRNAFYPSIEYTYDVTRYHVTGKVRNRHLLRVQNKINELITRMYSKLFVMKSLKKYDLVIYIWDTIEPSYVDVELFRKNGARIIFLFAGSEVRTYFHFSRRFDVSAWEFPSFWVNENIENKIRYIEVAESYADIIYSVPDQAGLQSKPYYHLQIPIDLSKFRFVNNRRKIPNVLHLPSSPSKKGTDIIEHAINELIREGVQLKFFTIRNLKHDDVPALLQDMDIVVDQIVFHGPGVLGFEAMASGCAVATRYIESSPPSFRPPVWNINAGNIKARLKQLFLNYDLQQKLIVEGRQYVEANNNAALVAANMLKNLDKPTIPEYNTQEVVNARS